MSSATIHQLGDKRAPSLDPMIALTAADMNAVNAVILERMQSKVALIPELAGITVTVYSIHSIALRHFGPSITMKVN